MGGGSSAGRLLPSPLSVPGFRAGQDALVRPRSASRWHQSMGASMLHLTAGHGKLQESGQLCGQAQVLGPAQPASGFEQCRLGRSPSCNAEEHSH